jgi:hypothetical protein
MLNKFRIWRLERRIAHLERMEAEAAASLQHLRLKILPALRQRRNDLLFPFKQRGLK